MIVEVTHPDFALELANLLPQNDTIVLRTGGYWNHLRVNRQRIVKEMRDPALNVARLKSMDLQLLRAIGAWFGQPSPQLLDDLLLSLAQEFAGQPPPAAAQLVSLLREFVYGRRTGPIEYITRLLLADRFESTLDEISASEMDEFSQRFCYALLVYLFDQERLPLLLYFETAERAGYGRFTLVPLTEVRGRILNDDEALQAEQKIKQGADLSRLTVPQIDDTLLAFEGQRSNYQCDCLDIFEDETSGETLIFILRYLREASIRQVYNVIFAEKAEWIVLRLYNQARMLQAHSTSAIGPRLAAAIASDLLAEKNVHYLKDTQSTGRKEFEELIRKLRNDEDPRLRLQELHLTNAPLPVADGPVLILRCSKDRSLAEPLASLAAKGIDLLGDLNNINSINIVFVVMRRAKIKNYIFKVHCRETTPRSYFLRYTVSNRALDIRREFEEYLFDEHKVRVIPGSGR